MSVLRRQVADSDEHECCVCDLDKQVGSPKLRDDTGTRVEYRWYVLNPEDLPWFFIDCTLKDLSCILKPGLGLNRPLNDTLTPVY